MILEAESRISVRVSPGAARSEVAGFADGVLRVKVAAPPLKGRANKELIDLLSRLLDLARGDISIVRGHSSRSKLIAVYGLGREEVMERLLSIL
ncbi:DUF167 domain-containing protein [Chloroflexota bacterium]